MIVLKVTYWSYVFSLFVKMSGLHSSSNVLLQSRPPWPPPPPRYPPPPLHPLFQLRLASSGFHLLSALPLVCPRASGGGGGLDNGVPVKVVLDVVGGHAMHLEVPSGYHVLLVHLCVVSLTNTGRRRVSSETVSPLKEV